MTTKVITTGDSSFTIKSKMPSDWITSAIVTVTVGDKAGTDLVAAQATTQLGVDTIALAVAAGAFVATLTTGKAYEAGDTIVIGSDAAGWQLREVDHYDSSSKIITFVTGLDEAVAALASIRSLDMSYTLDASADAWSGLKQVYVEWIPSTDNQPFRETWEVSSFKSAIANLEDEFRAAFHSLYEKVIQPEDFKKFEDRARDRIKQELQNKGRDLDLIVDSQILREVTLIEIALLIGRAYQMDTDQYERLEKDREYQFNILDNNLIWIDENEDGVQDDSENQPAEVVGIERGFL